MGSKEKTQGRLAWKSQQFVLKFRKSFKSFLQKSCENRCKCEFEIIRIDDHKKESHKH